MSLFSLPAVIAVQYESICQNIRSIFEEYVQIYLTLNLILQCVHNIMYTRRTCVLVCVFMLDALSNAVVD